MNILGKKGWTHLNFSTHMWLVLLLCRFKQVIFFGNCDVISYRLSTHIVYVQQRVTRGARGGGGRKIYTLFGSKGNNLTK